MTQPPRLLSRRKCESIQTYLFSKPFEFEGVKIGVVKCLPYTKKFYGIAVTHPVRYYYSFYTEPELLVGVIPSGDVEADEASQEGDDLVTTINPIVVLIQESKHPEGGVWHRRAYPKPAKT
jgi:hypothetical protein